MRRRHAGSYPVPPGPQRLHPCAYYSTCCQVHVSPPPLVLLPLCPRGSISSATVAVAAATVLSTVAATDFASVAATDLASVAWVPGHCREPCWELRWRPCWESFSYYSRFTTGNAVASSCCCGSTPDPPATGPSTATISRHGHSC